MISKYLAGIRVVHFLVLLAIIGSGKGLSPLEAKPLPGSMLTYCKLDTPEQTLVQLESKHDNFHPTKWIWKCV